VLDAGCGTGLCGAELKPFARTLTGVDLSAAMLDQARRSGSYDELIKAELKEYLAERPSAYDLIVSGDTFVYFGDLQPVLAAAARALRPGGWLVFSLERSGDEASHGYRLHPHGRYSHTRAYVVETLTRARLEPADVRAETLRKEAGRPVGGWIVVCRKAAPDSGS
jgi:predicted TPR repeat methyltransferase